MARERVGLKFISHYFKALGTFVAGISDPAYVESYYAATALKDTTTCVSRVVSPTPSREFALILRSE